MKKKLSSIILCAVICTATFAQTEKEHRSGFQFSLIYPLSTNGINAAKYTNGISINAMGGISKNEKAFTLGGLTNIILQDASGVQIAGLYNQINNNGQGLLLSGVASYTGHDYTGLQLAGLINISGNMKGITLGGVTNIALQDVSGIRIAGLYNHINNNGQGFLFSGVASYTGHDYTGLQLAGLTNIAGNIRGMQIASLINIAGDVKGVQIAGLLNVADNSDYPLGLVNLIKNGEKSIAVTYGEIGSIAVSFRSGGRVTYGIIGYGYNPNGRKNAYLTEAGLGAHIHLAPRFRLNNEIRTEAHHSSGNTTFKTGYYLLAAYKIAPHTEVFAGPGINHMYSDDMSDTGIFPGHSLWKKREAEKWQQVFVGYQLGVQYVF
ncbi:MAG: hypothetical protein LBH77_06385 [Tannerella sp.]|jgi:hypothetical protein|nr:hypothetical protein [Tannerella sp.]